LRGQNKHLPFALLQFYPFLFQKEKIEPEPNLFSGFQTGLVLDAQNQFSRSLALASEAGWSARNLFSGSQTGFGFLLEISC